MAIDIDEDKFLSNLKTLISFKTISRKNPEEFEKLYNWVREFFDGADADFIDFEKNGVRSILIKPKSSLKPKVLGLGHVDVVPASDDFFLMREKGGWIFGRGVSDMKTQSLIMIYALKKVIESEGRSDFWVALTGDEEVGGFDGAKVLIDWLEKEDLLPEIAFIPDGGSDFSYVEKEKGVAFFKAISCGKSCHGSRPWLGENSIVKMMNFASELMKVFPNPTSLEDWRNSLSITQISGGEAMNQIPDFCEAKFDVRITESESPESFLGKVKEVSSKYDIEISEIATGPALFSSSDDQISKKFIQIIKNVTGKSEVKIVHETGASDGRFLMGKNVKILMTEQNIEHSAHTQDEKCEIESIWKLYEVLESLLEMAEN